MKSQYFSGGIIVLIISLIIYFAKGDPIHGGHNFATIHSKFILHLFWSLITAYIGFGLIFIGIIIKEN
ncbi:hypothetical protein [Haloplasma contractile]|uniref:Uncharacterized protein n=1 Tax=Haloplasma contractile SSD-17B TaxID=1033810 RepID=F7PVQ2_9MOLU|nr:hypothetical protein [Haloplasma contractile]ERJ12777.1 hypothetical protein HLPCO_001117 [Haloplasma contractile SSD-17B]